MTPKKTRLQIQRWRFSVSEEVDALCRRKDQTTTDSRPAVALATLELSSKVFTMVDSCSWQKTKNFL